MRRFLLVVLYSLLADALFAPVQAAQATFLDEQYVVEQVVALLNPLPATARTDAVVEQQTTFPDPPVYLYLPGGAALTRHRSVRGVLQVRDGSPFGGAPVEIWETLVSMESLTRRSSSDRPVVQFADRRQIGTGDAIALGEYNQAALRSPGLWVYVVSLHEVPSGRILASAAHPVIVGGRFPQSNAGVGIFKLDSAELRGAILTIRGTVGPPAQVGFRQMVFAPSLGELQLVTIGNGLATILVPSWFAGFDDLVYLWWDGKGIINSFTLPQGLSTQPPALTSTTR